MKSIENLPRNYIRAGILLIAFFFFIPQSSPALAEGSADLTDNGGFRPYTEWDQKESAGIFRQTLIRVYVEAGEEINLGSSTPVSYSDPDDIVYRSPLGGQNGTCDVIDGGFGHIATRAEELAGPLPAPGGYEPCAFEATETGIYEIEFHAPVQLSPPNGNPDSLGVDAAFATDGTTFASVAAWDVTIHADDTPGAATIPGRAYTNLLALNMGSQGALLRSIVTILTIDGYQYEVNLNGIDPFGFLFFSNTKGPRDADLEPLYRSVQLIGGNAAQNLPAGISIQNPTVLNTAADVANYDITHKIFFNTPDVNMPAEAALPGGTTTWLYRDPDPPPVPNNLRFVGAEGTEGQMNLGLGGSFFFESNRVGNYEIILDISQNGVFGDANDRRFTGTANVGTNEEFWDGNDGNGNPVTLTALTFQASITTFAGEVHFPFADPENNATGLIIQRTRDPSIDAGTAPPTDPATIYYNDLYNFGASSADYDFSLCEAGESPPAPAPVLVPAPGLPPGAPPGCYGTAPAERDGRAGIISTGGAHEWSNLFGDQRIMETWTYFPSDEINLASGINIPEIDLAIDKTVVPTTVPENGAVTYTIVVTNNGPSDATGATVTDGLAALPLTNINWTCAAAGTAACGTAAGAGSINGVSVDIAAGAGNSVTFTVTANTTAPAGSVINNTAEVERPPDTNEPNTDNNTDDASFNVIVAPPPPTMIVSKDDGKTVVSADGEETTYTITYTNTSAQDAANVTLVDELPAGATFVACSDECSGTGPVQWTIGDVAAGATGSVTLTVALPPLDPPGTHVNRVTLSYTDVFGNPQPDETDTDVNTTVRQPTATFTPSSTPTETPLGPTATPTLTVTPGGPTVTPLPTNTPSGPTETPTNTPGGPTETPAPTNTPGGPTETPTPQPTPQDPDFQKGVEPPFAAEGDEAVWTITVTNSNTFVIKNVIVDDVIPSELEIVEVTTNDGKVIVVGQTIVVEIPEIPPGETVTITIRVRVREGISRFELRNQALLRIPPANPNDPGLTLEAQAQLVIAQEQLASGQTPLWSLRLRWLLILASLGAMSVWYAARRGKPMT